MCNYGMINIDELTPYENNARTHSEKQIEMLINSLTEFGFLNPVIIDENNMILAGHGRVEAAKRMELAEVPFRRVENLTDDQKRAYILADNKSYDMGAWDYEQMHTEAESLDIDMSLFGYEPLKVDLSDSTNDDDNNNIEEGKELDLSDYGDETFKYKCPNCEFGFNRGKKKHV